MEKNTQNALYHLPVQGLNVLFEAVMQQGKLIFWIRSPDNKKQIYVSPSFTDIFGVSVERLIDNPAEFDNFIFPADVKVFNLANKERLAKIDQIQPDFNHYRILNTNGSIHQLCDRSFPIFDRQGSQVALAGIASDVTKQINQTATFAPLQQALMTNMEFLLKEINQVLNTLHLVALKKPLNSIDNSESFLANKLYEIEGKSITVSTRQVDCIKGILQGGTVKMIARELKLSPRTVEDHINIIKNKLNCTSKAQLIKKLLMLN